MATVTGAQSSEEFTFNWLALKLLGKSLYSNPWAAVSELVANGLDAGAKNVWVLLDVSKGKKDSTLEILDDGTGMDREGIHTYVKVGYDKRVDPKGIAVVDSPMGRKGIGKLATLYLSDEFFLATRHKGNDSTWHFRVDENAADDDHPKLDLWEGQADYALADMWTDASQGTLVQVKHIDLEGFGDAALDALDTKLANQFLLSSMHDRHIWFCRKDASTAPPYFSEVSKEVAFKNFLMVYHNYPNKNELPSEIESLRNRKVKMGLDEEDVEWPIRVESMHRLDSRIGKAEESKPIQGIIEGLVDKDGQPTSVRYELTGWLAVHATINKEAARANDPRFTKNKFYNPAQIRLYVRNKLADENVLTMLGITQAFTNYIEGEISFDVLDDNSLADIATTNRQGFNENDERIKYLKKLLRPLVRAMISERNDIAKQLKDERTDRLAEVQARAKAAFVNEVESDMSRSNIADDIIADLMVPISNKLNGPNVSAKTRYRVLLSHSSKDKGLLDFIFYMLCKHGARENEIFYTSKDILEPESKDLTALSSRIRECIADVKTRILYVTTPNFAHSPYCMFEGGAGWVTRGVDEFDVLTTSYNDIPEFLNSNASTTGLLDKDKLFTLTTDVYNITISTLNTLVSHLNDGRIIEGIDELIDTFDTVKIPARHELKPGEEQSDYFNREFVDLWKLYVEPTKDMYVEPKRDECVKNDPEEAGK